MSTDAERIELYKFLNGYTAQDWREFIENVNKGDNEFRGNDYRKLIGDLEEAASLIARLRVDAEKMRAFCREALDEFWEGDGSMQDMGERHGLLIATEVAEPCGEACSCAEYGAEFPTECYRFAPCLREAATAPMLAEE